eukprot:5220453-Karenia_brevis.AAC.1
MEGARAGSLRGRGVCEDDGGNEGGGGCEDDGVNEGSEGGGGNEGGEDLKAWRERRWGGFEGGEG